MRPGPELDERVCRALGWGPTKGWDDPEQRYPAVSTDGNAMLRAIAAMRERGWEFEIGSCHHSHDGAVWAYFGIYRGDGADWPITAEYRMKGQTPAHAVALAILERLEGKAELHA